MKVSIRNYKSIRSLDFESRRVNVIIGEPNCGKTNVIEALSLFEPQVIRCHRKCLRINRLSEAFANHEVKRAIDVRLGSAVFGLGLLQLSKNLSFRIEVSPKSTLYSELKDDGSVDWGEDFRVTKPYVFDSEPSFVGDGYSNLMPPFGGNLPSLLMGDRASREVAADLFQRTGFTLQVNVADQSISVSKLIDGLSFSFPYTSSSETLRRILFYRLALETNRNSVLLFDEPEANTFPMFTKLFAEQIAADDRGNTFFLTTHSPYLLGSLIEKTPKEELAVVLCHMENFETKARVLTQDEVQGLLDLGADAFFNLDRLTEE